MPNSLLPKPETAEDGIYHVYSMCYARAPERRVHQNFLRPDLHDGPMPLDFNLWIIRNSHRTIIVDTGFDERTAAQRRNKLDFDPVDGLSRLGIAPDSIDDIILTHLHFDHAGNLDRFPKARFHIQDAEVGFATGRCMCEPYLRSGYGIEDVVTLVRHVYADRVCFHDGAGEPFPGISLHALPGHTMGIQSVRVMTPRGPVVLASDVSHFYTNTLLRAPIVSTADIIATMKSYTDLMKIAGSMEYVIPGHDPRVRALYPRHTYGGIDVHALHETPKPHDLSELSKTNTAF